MVDRANGANLPTYGSAEWLSLPEGDPVKVASVVVAAESWAQDGDDIPGRLAIEVAASYAAHKATEDADYVARAEAHREQWRGRPTRPTKSFMERRREQLEAVQPQPGDYPGRGTGA